ncbi:glycoside hydrolase family 99-like domain-containing protein [Pedobacter sp. SYSU D00535]|uniref:glycosyltransferase WbsX family protein n=1 Tax=Pedobacter sp. SYSU D00535 TaxID=2810308 RepID=UPI001A9772AF|nr:glycoside hydrolase family 99-like domain-containing protein [Pedobacter sp. SYSU D00535]
MSKAKGLKYYAFFLPQFHSCPYNNRWWGEGFTEWNLVKESRPQFDGHNQPSVPLDGYYDLNNNEALESQFKEAKEHGIDGFVLYHYWFEGKRPLGAILDRLLDNPQIEFRFSLCWANQTWSRTWNYKKDRNKVLLHQGYERSKSEQLKHFRLLLKAFLDPRYIKIGDSPMFQIYKPEEIPDIAGFIKDLREFVLAEAGLKIHIIGVITLYRFDFSYLKLLDGVMLWQPGLAMSAPDVILGPSKPTFNQLFSAIGRISPRWVQRLLLQVKSKLVRGVKHYDYDKLWQTLLDQYKFALKSKNKVYTAAFVNFDNSPRYRDKAIVVNGFAPGKFGSYLKKLAREIAISEEIEHVVFLFAWNEWGEGAYLQKDERWQNQRLEVVKESKEYYNQLLDVK